LPALPAQAKTRPHCAQRRYRHHCPIGTIALVALALFIKFATESAARDEERLQARSEIDTVKAWCSPDTPDDFVEARTEAFQQKIDAMHLEMEEKWALKAAFDNQLELRGCGFSARNQPKKRHR
jgi:hypothetical protein